MASTRTSPPVKVFIDSSVLIAAPISMRGAARELLNAGILGCFELVTSRLVLTESERNIMLKAPSGWPTFQLFEEAFAASLVRPLAERVLDVATVVELKDAAIVAGAIEAGAGYLAIYDRRHLLRARDRIRGSFGIAVVTPAELVGQEGAK